MFTADGTPTNWTIIVISVVTLGGVALFIEIFKEARKIAKEIKREDDPKKSINKIAMLVLAVVAVCSITAIPLVMAPIIMIFEDFR